MKLIPFAPAHFPTLAGWFASERDAVQWGGPWVSFPLDAPQLDAMLAEGRTRPAKRLCWMAEKDGDLVGHVQLGWDWRNGIARVSRVAVAPHARGRGLAADMVALALDEAFTHPEVERAELDVYSFNTAAIRTYERLGFVREGVRRSSARVGTERWDTVMMALLRAERP